MSGRGDFRVRAENTGWEGPGGYMQAKVRKLEDQFNADANLKGQASSIFRGVAIHVDGWTDPSTDELKSIMAKNGGKFHVYYSRTKTTHVIASNLPHAKRKQLRPDQKVVKPQWIKDSLKAKELLPIEEYLLVPVEEGAQSRITSIFGKGKTTATGSLSKFDQNASCSSSLHYQSSENDAKLAFVEGSSKNSDVTDKTSRSICSTTDSNFLSEFYSHSRLHFLSTWKMELKEYVRSLQTEESLIKIPLSGYENLLKIGEREGLPQDYGHAVMHIDMDCFFVSVGLKSRPELRGLPVAVTHSTGSGITSERPDADPEFEMNYYQNKYGTTSKLSGAASSAKSGSSMFGPGFSASEIASCSYEARAAGVKNGMFMGKAKQLCPNLRVIPYDFDAYRQTSDKLYDTLATFTRHIEAVSCDEALVDISKLAKETGLSPIKIAACIRKAVKEVTGCNASTGVGPNIALARMATRHAKPDGEYMVSEKDVKDFMKAIPVKDLPGVGRSTALHLQEMGIKNCGELQNFSLSTLKQKFGVKTGEKLHNMSLGIDTRKVEIEKERKSVSAEVNYGIRLSDEDEAKTFLKNLSKEVVNRLKGIGMRGKRVTLKIMVRRSDAPQESAKYGGHGICDSLSRTSQITLANQGNLYEEDCSAIYECTWTILTSMHLKVCDLRGIGIQVTQLQPIAESKESSSATFLKKFIVKKSTNPAENVVASTSSSKPIDAMADETVAQESNNYDPNMSFLDALPFELRKEVEETLSEQRQALERNFLNMQNENSNDSHASSVIYIDDSSRGSTSSVTLFPEQGKVGEGTSRTKRKTQKGGNKKKGARTKGSKSSASASSKRLRSSNNSPNKLITDMFPVTYTPKKSKISPAKSETTLPVINSTEKSAAVTVVERAKRRLLVIQENETSHMEEAINLISDRPEERPHNEPDQDDKLPSLGGAFKIEDIRQALSEWITAYSDDGPLECDVEDFIGFEFHLLSKVLVFDAFNKHY